MIGTSATASAETVRLGMSFTKAVSTFCLEVWFRGKRKKNTTTAGQVGTISLPLQADERCAKENTKKWPLCLIFNWKKEQSTKKNQTEEDDEGGKSTLMFSFFGWGKPAAETQQRADKNARLQELGIDPAMFTDEPEPELDLTPTKGPSEGTFVRIANHE